jgi:ABC-type antimicrobial peptide transport system permease subunit
MMIPNYLKTAWRNWKKNKGFFTLNFVGLYVSVIASVLIALLIFHETSFDRSRDKGLAIYRVVDQQTSPKGKDYSAVTPYPLATAMRTAMPDQALISQIDFEKDGVVTVDNKNFKETNIIFADSVFPRLFPLTVKEGSIERAFSEPGFAVLTQGAATRYFGKESAMGKKIRFAGLIDLQVVAIVQDAPSNTHLPYHVLIPYLSMNTQLIGGFPLDQWGMHASGFVYIGLPGQGQVNRTETILRSIADQHVNNTGKSKGIVVRYSLQPLPDIHYDQLYAGSNPTYTINYNYLYLIGAIGLFLILAACVNYTNLSTALAIRKSKEVGVRKTMGATRSQLIRQFFAETFLMTALVIIAAALSVRLFIPLLNTLLDKNIPMNWFNSQSLALLTALWIGVSLFAGLYPAVVLSGFNPITALKSKTVTPGTSVLLLRRSLVIFQFVTAHILIIAVIVVAKQMDYVRSTPLGFNRAQVVDIGLDDNKPEHLQLLRDQLSNIPGVQSVSLSVGAPVSDNNVGTGFNLREKYKSEELQGAVKAADKNYLKTYELQLLAGRWFDDHDETNVASSVPDSLRRYAFVLNETAVRSLGFKSPQEALGKYVTFGMNDISAPVIGVVKDYHTSSLREALKPVLMVEYPFFYYNAGIRLAPGYSAATLAAIEKVWTAVYPHGMYETNFLDERVAAQYKGDRQTQQLFYVFTSIAVIINILGLVGLLSFIIQQKSKEVSIRKVLGASLGNISFILSKDFLRLCLIAFLIAGPVAGIFMHRWLDDFAYRTDLSWWVFPAAIGTTFSSLAWPSACKRSAQRWRTRLIA